MSWTIFVSKWWTWAIAISWQLAAFVVLILCITKMTRANHPRLRHTLWLLVLLKVFLPPSLSAPWNPVTWMNDPTEFVESRVSRIISSPQHTGEKSDPVTKSPVLAISVLKRNASLVWISGMFVAVTIAGLQYLRLSRKTARLSVNDEGRASVALERSALRLNLSNTPDLRITPDDSSPFLIGVWRPSIVIPESLVTQATPDELETVLLHELVHYRHRDTWIGWVQVVAQCGLWFHPAVWLTNYCLNHERESVCDDTVLRRGGVDPENYCETLLRVLKLARGYSPVAGSLVGVFERGDRIQNRLESIMQFNENRRTPGILFPFVVATMAVMFLPMGPGTPQTALEAATPAHVSLPTTIASAPPAKPARNEAAPCYTISADRRNHTCTWFGRCGPCAE